MNSQSLRHGQQELQKIDCRLAILLFVLHDFAYADQVAQEWCSVNSQGNGNVITLNCRGIDPQVVDSINKKLEQLSHDQDQQAGALKKEADRLAAEYFKYRALLEKTQGTSEEVLQAWNQLRSLDFDKLAHSSVVVKSNFRNFVDAIASFDQKALDVYEAQGDILPQDLLKAFGTRTEFGDIAAVEFFKTAAYKSGAYVWLKRMVVDNGLNPSARIELPEKEYTSLFWSAIDAKNVGGALVLLDLGATPHSPSSTTGFTRRFPRFAWPIEYTTSLTWLEVEEHKRLVEKMIAKGAIVDNTKDARDILEKLGLQYSPSPTICQLKSMELCHAHSDVCASVKLLTKVYNLNYFVNGPFDHFISGYLIAADGDAIVVRAKTYAAEGGYGDEHSRAFATFFPKRKKVEIFRYEYSLCAYQSGPYQHRQDCWWPKMLEYDPQDGAIYNEYPSMKAPSGAACTIN